MGDTMMTLNDPTAGMAAVVHQTMERGKGD